MSQISRDSAYHAARAAMAWADLSAHGWLRVAGRDRLAFLQRLSTNDFRRLAPGDGLPAVLAGPTGRVIALLIACVDEKAVHLRASPGQARSLTRHLSSLIFWNDEVEVADLSAETMQIGLYGPAAAAWIEATMGVSLAELPPYGWRGGRAGETTVLLQRGGDLEAADWTMIADATHGAELRSLLAALPMLDAHGIEALRVERGIPTWGHELSAEVTPLEAGLRAAISENKGCYTGQEVIARQLSYDKVARRLVGLLLPVDAPTTGLTGAPIAGRGRGGFVGSAIWSPGLMRPIALAVAPREVASPGCQVEVRHGDGEILATVVDLPFVHPPASSP
jgi:folate-binding protein YgfZ